MGAKRSQWNTRSVHYLLQISSYPVYHSTPQPKQHDLIYLNTKIPGSGRSSQQQLWRLVPGAGRSNSFIENNASGADSVIDVQGYNPETPLQLYPRKAADNGGKQKYPFSCRSCNICCKINYFIMNGII